MTIPSVLSYEIKDDLGVTASMPHFVNIPTATTLAQIQTFANDYTPLLQAVTDGEITGITVKIPLVITGGASAPVAGSEVERTGLINFEQNGSNYKQAIDILALSEGLIISGKIDLSNAAYIAWRNFVLATTLGITFTSKFGNNLLAVLDTLITFRKRRKSENHRSFEVAP